MSEDVSMQNIRHRVSYDIEGGSENHRHELPGSDLGETEKLFKSLISNCRGVPEATHEIEDKYVVWYLKSFGRHFQRLPRTLKLLLSEDGISAVTEERILAVFRLLATIMSDVDRPTLDKIFLELQTANLLRKHTSSEKAHQLIFMVIGWLTTAYDPDVSCRAQHVSTVVAPSFGEGRYRATKVNSEAIREVNNLPVHQMLRHFGQLPLGEVPQTYRLQSPGPKQNLFSEQLIASYMTFKILNHVGGISIEFVGSIGQHLEFDRTTKRIGIFVFPSACAAMSGRPSVVSAAHGNVKSNYLESLFKSYCEGQEFSSGGFENQEALEGSNIRPSKKKQCYEFFREVLLTYQFIFGYDPSRSLASRQLTFQRNLRGGSHFSIDDDPLLKSLLCHDQDAVLFYKSLGFLPPSAQCTARNVFPTFGRRLLKIQQFVVEQNPSDIVSLWYDRRDINRFYTFWAVVVVGGASIILGILQLAVGILQITLS